MEAAAREWNSTKADEIFSPILIGNVHQEKVVAYRPPLVTHFHTEFHFCIWFDPLSFRFYWALKEYLAWNADKQIKVKRAHYALTNNLCWEVHTLLQIRKIWVDILLDYQ